jgi:hypothetical protein
VAKQFITAQIITCGRGKIKGGRHNIVEATTAHATEMVVLGRIGVEAGLAAGIFQFFNHPHTG